MKTRIGGFSKAMEMPCVLAEQGGASLPASFASLIRLQGRKNPSGDMKDSRMLLVALFVKPGFNQVQKNLPRGDVYDFTKRSQFSCLLSFVNGRLV